MIPDEVRARTVSTARLLGYTLSISPDITLVLCPKGTRVYSVRDYWPSVDRSPLDHYLVRHHLHDHYGIEVWERWWSSE